MNCRAVEKQQGTDPNYLWQWNSTWHGAVIKPGHVRMGEGHQESNRRDFPICPDSRFRMPVPHGWKRIVRFRRLLLQGRRIRCSMCLHFWTQLIVEEKGMAETISAQGDWEEANTCYKSNCRVNQEKAEKEGSKVRQSSQNTVNSSIRFAWEALIK